MHLSKSSSMCCNVSYKGSKVSEISQMILLFFGTTRALENCLRRLISKGLKPNRDKCVFLSNTLEFFGQIFSKDGIRPDPKRVTDLLNAPRPGNVSEVRSLLGMANYSS